MFCDFKLTFTCFVIFLVSSPNSPFLSILKTSYHNFDHSFIKLQSWYGNDLCSGWLIILNLFQMSFTWELIHILAYLALPLFKKFQKVWNFKSC